MEECPSSALRRPMRTNKHVLESSIDLSLYINGKKKKKKKKKTSVPSCHRHGGTDV